MSTRTLVKSAPQTSTFKVWDEPTALAQVNDYIRQPFAPVMQIINKDTFCDGRVRLLVKPVSASYTEEWIIESKPTVEQQPTSVPSEDIQVAQPIGSAGDTVCCQLHLSVAQTEFEQGGAHGKLDVAERSYPIYTSATCDYAAGYIQSYNAILNPPTQPKDSKKFQWIVTYNSKWQWYDVWVGERCIGCNSNYEQAERIAQKYIATT